MSFRKRVPGTEGKGRGRSSSSVRWFETSPWSILSPRISDPFERAGHCAHRSWWVAVMIRTMLAVFSLSFVCAAQSNEPKQVLILSQEDLSWPAFRLIDENVRTTLRTGSPQGILIFSEHMDRVHFPDPDFQRRQTAWIRRKYADAKIDLVIGVGDVPTDMLPDVPLLYLGTDSLRKRPSRTESSKEVASIWMETDARKSLDAARLLQPRARQVVVIGGSSPTEKNLLDQVRDQISTDSYHLSTIYLTNSTFSEISQTVAALGPESIVLFATLSRDAGGRRFISAEVIPKIATVSGAPVYVLLDTHVGSGAVGGYVTSFAELGKQAGEMGLQFLAGEHPKDAVARSGYLFDRRQLRRWKLSESALPSGSVVLYRQPTAWESYGRYILGAILLCVIQALLIFGLLRQRTKRRRVEESLIERLTFERLLSNLSTTFINLPEDQVGATIEKSLGSIAEFLKIDRVTLFEYSRRNAELIVTSSWPSKGVQPVPSVVKTNRFPWWTALLLRGEIALVSDLNFLPEEAAAEREHLQKIDATSVATVPLKAGDEFFGGISFVSTKRRVLWTADLVEQLKLLAEIFSNALMRKRAQEARLRHAAIVESSDDAIISVNLDGIILSWNVGAERLFAFSETEAVGQPIAILIPEELRDEETKILQHLRAGGTFKHYETVRLTKDGQKLDVSLTLSPVRDSAGMVVGVSKIARDITARKRADRVLRESEERFRLVANTAPVLIWMAATDKLCTFFNQGWLSFTGRSMEQELGEGWLSSVHPEDVQRCLGIYSASFDARAEFEMEYRLRRFDGEYRWVVDYGAPRFESDGTFCGYIGSCVDISERKSSEESLHALGGRLIRAQEEERARIARELHDDFSQRLALVGIALGQLWKKLPESEMEERASVLEILRQTKEMSSDMHSLSHRLHSSKLELVGLVPALIGLCREIGEKYKIGVHFTELGSLPNITKDVALCLFRVTQEALTNIVKHSQAKSADVKLGANAKGVSLRITDTGRGFDPDLKNPAAGIGLVGMRERLRLVGGSLSLKSELMQGTEIFAEVPLTVYANKAQERAQAVGE